jgi:hypothetical protein
LPFFLTAKRFDTLSYQEIALAVWLGRNQARIPFGSHPNARGLIERNSLFLLLVERGKRVNDDFVILRRHPGNRGFLRK